jgi:PBP1b-binding outer membrane lipoprotein LpoB
MKRTMTILGIVVAVLFVASCTTFQMSGVQQNAEMPSYETVGEFETSVMVHEFVGAPGGANLLNVTATAMDDEIYDAIRREIQKYSGDAAVNVTVEYKAKFFDMLLTGLTAGLYSPAHAEISGTVVKYQ